jgi:N utilization substance protein A
MEVVVPDDQLSLAIGKRGQNVRLASRLTGWKLDVIGETNYNTALKDGYRSLLDLEGIGEKRATDLYDADFKSVGDVASASVEDLLSVKGMTESRAESLIDEAIRYVSLKQDAETAEKEGSEEPAEALEEKDPLTGEGQDIVPEKATKDDGVQTESSETSQIADTSEQDIEEPKTPKSSDE